MRRSRPLNIGTASRKTTGLMTNLNSSTTCLVNSVPISALLGITKTLPRDDDLSRATLAATSAVGTLVLVRAGDASERDVLGQRVSRDGRVRGGCRRRMGERIVRRSTDEAVGDDLVVGVEAVGRWIAWIAWIDVRGVRQMKSIIIIL